MTKLPRLIAVEHKICLLLLPFFVKEGVGFLSSPFGQRSGCGVVLAPVSLDHHGHVVLAEHQTQDLHGGLGVRSDRWGTRGAWASRVGASNQPQPCCQRCHQSGWRSEDATEQRYQTLGP